MNDIINITINGKDKVTISKNTSIRDIIKNNRSIFNYDFIGIKVNNEIVCYDYKVTKSVNIETVETDDINGYKMYQAGLKFVMLVALKKLFGNNVDVIYDHSIERGVHVTILNREHFNQDDTIKLKNKMRELINEDKPITKLVVDCRDAYNYYEAIGYHEKALNIHNISNQFINLYRLDKYINYFFVDMPDKTGVLKLFDVVFISNNELALMMPLQHIKNKVPEYVHYSKVIACFKAGNVWLNRIGIPYVANINKIIGEGRVNDLIRTCETNLDNSIHDVASDAIKRGIKYLLIAGPSSSGKTTTAKKIALNLRAQGMEPIMVSTDDYFFDREDTPKNDDGSFDFEGLSAIDVKELNKDLNDLKNGLEVELPTYNFLTGHREYSGKKSVLKENGIVVIEGLHTLNDELTYNLDKSLKYKVYLSPFIPVNIDHHNYISTTDLRLIRRIIRDNNNRGYDVSKTIDCWQTVRNGEEKNIFPYIDLADRVVNTSLAYEVGVLKVYVLPLLYSVKDDSPYYSESRRLICFLKHFLPISSEFVSKDSIIREFIGGSNFRNEGDK